MTESPYRTLIASPDAVITDAQGNLWSLEDGQVVENGVPDPTTANVIALAYAQTGYSYDSNGHFHSYGQVWQENASLLWWAATDAGWSPNYGTLYPPVPSSADGTVIMPGDATPIFDQKGFSGGNIWTISDGQVVKNGVVDTTTANVIAMEYQFGAVWAENASQLWWSYSQASDGSTVWTPGTVPVARLWIGGDDNNASCPDDWSPAGAPGPGDKLTMTSGTMNVYGDALAGDTLTIPPAYSLATATINLTSADASVSASAGPITIDINVLHGTSKLTLSGSLHGDIQIGSCSTLVLSANLSSSTMQFTGGTIEFTGNNSFGGTVFNDNLTGIATINENVFRGSGGNMEVNGAVGSGLTFNLSSAYYAVGSLQIDHPETFNGTIGTLDFGDVIFMGLHATSAEMLNGMLELFDGDTLVNSTRIGKSVGSPDPSHYSPSNYVLATPHVQQESNGVHLFNGASGDGTFDLPLTIQS